VLVQRVHPRHLLGESFRIHGDLVGGLVLVRHLHREGKVADTAPSLLVLDRDLATFQLPELVGMLRRLRVVAEEIVRRGQPRVRVARYVWVAPEHEPLALADAIEALAARRRSSRRNTLNSAHD
jgi:hypothetical protein